MAAAEERSTKRRKLGDEAQAGVGTGKLQEMSLEEVLFENFCLENGLSRRFVLRNLSEIKKLSKRVF